MPDNLAERRFEAIRTPDQMIADAIRCRQEIIDGDLETPSYFVKNPDGWKVIYKEDSGYEANSARNDEVIALLRLADGVMSLNRNPIKADHVEVSLESFFRRTISDKETFGNLHTQMSYDPLLTCMVLARLEDIFEIPIEEKVYTGIQRELIIKPNLLTETQPRPNTPKEQSKATDNPNRSRIKRLATAATLGALTTVSIAACSLISSTESPSETLAPLSNSASPTTETTSTTVAEIGCGDITVVGRGETLTQIAARCEKSIEQIALWNGIDNVNPIGEGLVLRLTEPEVVIETTTTPETTIATVVIPEETTTTVTAIEVESTLPPVSETTAPPPPPNDGMLTKAECDAKGGFQHRFASGEYLFVALQKIYGIQPNQSATLLETPLIDEYHLAQITASTDGQLGAECMPTKSTILPYLPDPIFTTVTTTD